MRRRRRQKRKKSRATARTNNNNNNNNNTTTTKLGQSLNAPLQRRHRRDAKGSLLCQERRRFARRTASYLRPLSQATRARTHTHIAL